MEIPLTIAPVIAPPTIETTKTRPIAANYIVIASVPVYSVPSTPRAPKMV